jgi:enediyne biosynthesis protein E4
VAARHRSTGSAARIRLATPGINAILIGNPEVGAGWASGRRAILVGLLAAAWARPARAAELRFRQVAAELGVRFEHRHFGTGEKYMPENMGAGVAVLDYDGDGRLDLFFAQGAPLAGDQLAPPGAGDAARLPGSGPAATTAGAAAATNGTGHGGDGGDRLFRQRGDGTFEDVTAAAGIVEQGYGMGVAFGDVDRDGDLDLYVTNFGPNTLWRNRGDGTFEDATADAGVAAGGWSSAAGFFDADADGDLDLYVARYLDFAFDRHRFCGNAQAKIRAYCHPDVYDGVPDLLYRNDGSGRFTDWSRQAGLLATPADKGLGVLLQDLDGDGAQDIYVANDSTMNYLYLGDGRGRFREQALLAGVGFDGTGAPEASMGIELGDLDGDGAAEIFLTHLDQETNTLYRAAGPGLWTDATDRFGLGAPSRPWVGFGTVFFDPDDDGDLDVFVTNGHIIDNIDRFDPARHHRQPSQLFVNPGTPPLAERSELLGLELLVGRGAVAADLDADSDEDLVVTQNGGPALVLRNETAAGGGSLAVRLRGARSNPQGFGARLELTVGQRTLVRWSKSSTSYLSQGPPEIHFGLGVAERAAGLVVHWPSGQIDRHGPLAAGRIHTLTEGVATVESVPLARISD